MFATCGNNHYFSSVGRKDHRHGGWSLDLSHAQTLRDVMHDDLYAMQMLCYPHGEPVDSSRIPETFGSRPQRRRGPSDLCHYALPYILVLRDCLGTGTDLKKV
jgi:hypothetical protein